MDPTDGMLDEATCSYCLEYFTEPRDLQCGHTFCTLCLQDLAKKPDAGPGSIVCPACGSRSLLDYRSVLGLTKNFRASNAADRARRVKTHQASFAMPESIRFDQPERSFSSFGAAPSTAPTPNITASILLPPMPASIAATPSANPTPLYFSTLGGQPSLSSSPPSTTNPEVQITNSTDDSISEFYCIPNTLQEERPHHETSQVSSAFDATVKSEPSIDTRPPDTFTNVVPPPSYTSVVAKQQEETQPTQQTLLAELSPTSFAYFSELLQAEDMGFTDRALNADLLLQFSGDLPQVINALLSGVVPDNPIFTAAPPAPARTHAPVPIHALATPHVPAPKLIPTSSPTSTASTTIPSSSPTRTSSSSTTTQPTRFNTDATGYTSTITESPKTRYQQQHPQPQGGVFSKLKKLLWSDDSEQTHNEPHDPNQPYVNFAQFKISLNKTNELVAEWAQGLYFAPAHFTRDMVFSGVHAYFVPFWLFQATTRSLCSSGTDGLERSNTYNDLRACALLDDDEREVVAMLSDWQIFDVHNAPQPMQSTFKAPHTWETTWKDFVEKDVIKQEEQRIEAEWRVHFNAKPRKFETKVEFLAVERQLVFLPVYIGSYTYSNRQYTVVINGQTGTVQGQRPYGTGTLGAVGYASLNLLGRSIWGGGKDEGESQQNHRR